MFKIFKLELNYTYEFEVVCKTKLFKTKMFKIVEILPETKLNKKYITKIQQQY